MWMLSNNGMQLTKAARCAPFAFRSWGQSLRAAFAADPGCSTDAEPDRALSGPSWENPSHGKPVHRRL